MWPNENAMPLDDNYQLSKSNPVQSPDRQSRRHNLAKIKKHINETMKIFTRNCAFWRKHRNISRHSVKG